MLGVGSDSLATAQVTPGGDRRRRPLVLHLERFGGDGALGRTVGPRAQDGGMTDITAADVPVGVAHLSEATARLLDALAAVSPQAVRNPSLLPDWSVGHVLTHIARNADGQRNLLHWAATGEPTPMYPSPEARAADIAAGAERMPDEIVEDVRASASKLAAAIAHLPDTAWLAMIDTGRGGPVTADVVLAQRLAEVELHHHDLGIDSGLALLSDDAGAALLAAVLRSYVRTRALAGLVLEPDGAGSITVGAEPAGTQATVRGRAVALAGWLAGRSDGGDLRSDGPLPELPSW